MPQHMKHTLHCLCAVGGRLHDTQKQERNILFYSKTKTALCTNPKWFSFSFSFREKRVDLFGVLPSPPAIWCTFTVSKNEFCFQYICQIKTSGRKKNLHFKEPHVSSHFWHCRTQHKNTQTNQDSRYKLFHRIYILKGTSTNITK